MKKFHEYVQEYANLESDPKTQGHTLIMVLTPIK